MINITETNSFDTSQTTTGGVPLTEINSETLEEWVVYTALYGDKKTWIRPKYMFFEEVPKEKDNPTGQKYRFEYIGDEI